MSECEAVELKVGLTDADREKLESFKKKLYFERNRTPWHLAGTLFEACVGSVLNLRSCQLVRSGRIQNSLHSDRRATMPLIRGGYLGGAADVTRLLHAQIRSDVDRVFTQLRQLQDCLFTEADYK